MNYQLQRVTLVQSWGDVEGLIVLEGDNQFFIFLFLFLRKR